MIQPEQTSLRAYQHIQTFLNGKSKSQLSEKETNAVLRLSQYLRVFGLLSATGYLNQTNDQANNETRQQVGIVWKSLLGQLWLDNHPGLGNNPKKVSLPSAPQLMTAVKKLAQDDPAAYMDLWRRSLIMANHWCFWAKAHKE